MRSRGPGQLSASTCRCGMAASLSRRRATAEPTRPRRVASTSRKRNCPRRSSTSKRPARLPRTARAKFRSSSENVLDLPVTRPCRKTRSGCGSTAMGSPSTRRCHLAQLVGESRPAGRLRPRLDGDDGWHGRGWRAPRIVGGASDRNDCWLRLAPEAGAARESDVGSGAAGMPLGGSGSRVAWRRACSPAGAESRRGGTSSRTRSSRSASRCRLASAAWTRRRPEPSLASLGAAPKVFAHWRRGLGRIGGT